MWNLVSVLSHYKVGLKLDMMASAGRLCICACMCMGTVVSMQGYQILCNEYIKYVCRMLMVYTHVHTQRHT